MVPYINGGTLAKGVFDNRILRRIFGSRRDANGEWRRLHTEELHSVKIMKALIPSSVLAKFPAHLNL